MGGWSSTPSTGGGSFTGGAIAAPIQVTGGTQTAVNPAIDVTQTWSNAAVQFTGIRGNFTVTADLSGGSKSYLIDLQTASVSKFNVDWNGSAWFGNEFRVGGSRSAPLCVTSDQSYYRAISGVGIYWSSTAGSGTCLAALQYVSTNYIEFNNNTVGTRIKVGVGGLALGFAAKTGAYTATANDAVISCDATSGAFTVTLPTAVGVSGQVYTIKKVDASANAVTVGTTSSQTIDAGTTSSLSAQWAVLRVVSNGANWLVI